MSISHNAPGLSYLNAMVRTVKRWYYLLRGYENVICTDLQQISVNRKNTGGLGNTLTETVTVGDKYPCIQTLHLSPE